MMNSLRQSAILLFISLIFFCILLTACSNEKGVDQHSSQKGNGSVAVQDVPSSLDVSKWITKMERIREIKERKSDFYLTRGMNLAGHISSANGAPVVGGPLRQFFTYDATQGSGKLSEGYTENEHVSKWHGAMSGKVDEKLFPIPNQPPNGDPGIDTIVVRDFLVSYPVIWTNNNTKLSEETAKMCAIRIENVPGEVLKEWRTALAQVTGEKTGSLWTSGVIADIDGLYSSDKRMIEGRNKVYLARLKSLRPEQIDAMMRLPVRFRTSAAGYIIQCDEFFPLEKIDEACFLKAIESLMGTSMSGGSSPTNIQADTLKIVRKDGVLKLGSMEILPNTKWPSDAVIIGNKPSLKVVMIFRVILPDDTELAKKYNLHTGGAYLQNSDGSFEFIKDFDLSKSDLELCKEFGVQLPEKVIKNLIEREKSVDKQ